MKFAIYDPYINGYWYHDGSFQDDWKKAQIFLTREDAEKYLNWIINHHEDGSAAKRFIVRQVK